MKKRSLLLTSLLIGSVAFCTLSSSSVLAIAQQSTLTMSISSSDLSINIAPGVNGSFAKSSASTIGINTDNFTGYTLSIATLSPGSGSSVPSTSLSDINDNEIESISSSISEATFSSSSTYNNKWGYRPSQYIVTDTVNNTMTTISDNTDFLPAPTTEGDLLDITDVPNANNNTYTLDFGARVDYSLASGAYSRTMVVMAVANDIVYNINYDENTDDTSVANMPSINPQPITMPGQTPTADSTATLSSDVPTRTGYTFTGWCDIATTIDNTTGAQICNGNTYSANGTYGIDQTTDGTNIKLYAMWATSEYDVTFKTSTGISQINVKQDSTTKCTIENNANNSTTGSICKLRYSIPYTIEATVATGYSFNSWDNSTSYGTIADASLTSTTFTTGTDNTTITANAAPNQYAITLNANGGTLGSTTATATYNSTTLSTITNPTRANDTGTRTISGFTLTASGTNATVTYPSSGCTSASNCKSTNTTTYTFNGWYKESGATNKIATNATTPVLQASTDYTDANGKWTSTSGQTLYAGWTSSTGSYSSVTLPTITRTGSTCGWSTSSTATSISYNSGASFTPSGNTTLYGVCVTNITLNLNGGTGGTTSGIVKYNDTVITNTSGGNLTNPTKANSSASRTVSGFTLTTSGTNAIVSSTSTLTSTATVTYTFNGWHKDSGTGTLIGSSAVKPALQASTTYTDANSKWTYTTAGAITLYAGWTASTGAYSAVTLPTITRTGSTCGWSTSSTATTISYNSGASFTPTANTTLYGVCRNNITLNKNGATNSPTTSTTATYGATSLGAIATLPTRSYTISGFTAGTGASDATISSTSTLTSTYTFNGWYKESGATNKIASNAATPALQASTTYTDANKKWTYTTASAVTLYAGWSSQAKTLPTISKTGYSCKWNTKSDGSGTSYNSGASVTPTSNLTLYGYCTVNTYSLAITFAGSGVSSVQVRTASGTGGTLMGTVSSSGGSVSGLTYNTAYYLRPTFSSGNELSKWAKTSSTGTLSSTSADNPTFKMGAGNGAVTITGTKIYMQNMTSSKCTTTAMTAYDNRDESAYRIQKLADGKCWMLDNLALDITNSTVKSKLTNSTTNASDTTLDYLKNGGGTTSDKYATAGIASWASDYSYSAPLANMTYKTTTASDTISQNGGYKIGGYYNYCAASAGSYCYGNGHDTGSPSGDATEDICPKGWRMPTGGNSGEYRTLYYSLNYSTYNEYRTALRIPLSGHYVGPSPYYGSDSTASGIGSESHWWSSSSQGSIVNTMWSFYVDTGGFVPWDSGTRYKGFSVRCVLK